MSKLNFRSNQAQRAHICYDTVRLCLVIFKVNPIIFNTHEDQDLKPIYIHKIIFSNQPDRYSTRGRTLPLHFFISYFRYF